MCGIVGAFAPGRRLDAQAVNPMIASLAHRGPDDRGVEVLAGGSLVFGHLRLSILDLSALGHQPMATSDQKTWIVYNGEIYNFREIKAELQGFGWVFRSDTDTEVILAAYRQWGLEAVNRFRGMFAFAIWDETQNLLHLCRDRFGVKPLYYSLRSGLLAFASESKALSNAGYTSRAVDPVSVAEFVQYGYISAPRGIFADIHTVRPGAICTFDIALRMRERTYWSARDLFDGEAAIGLRHELSVLPEKELLDRVEASLQKSFEYRMVADVPVGVFLSGGMDSSLVAALLAQRSGFKLKTFTIGYGVSEFDETAYARTVADTLGCVHTELIVPPQAALDVATELPTIADEPIGDSSLIPTLLVSRLAREHVKVALSGDGADELFGGYARYAYCGNFVERRSRMAKALYHLSAEMLDRLPPGLIARGYAVARGGGPRFAAINDKLRKFVRMAQAKDEFAAYDAAISEWSTQRTKEFVTSKTSAGSGARKTFESVVGAGARDRFMHYDMTRYLPGDLLTKVDRASMSVSLEAREPFLDHETARLAAALPMEWKIRGSQGKYLLRKLLSRYFPPAFFDRPKQGFSAPVGEWLRGPLREVFQHELSAAQVREFQLLDPKTVPEAAANFLTASHRDTSAAGAWILLQLQQWAAHWLPEPAGQQHQEQRA